MSVMGIMGLLMIASLIALSNGQCLRIRSNTSCQQQPGSQTSTSSLTSLEDLTTLLAIVRALEEREASKPTINNAEEIIMQLVNALVYATTHNVGCHKGGGHHGGHPNTAEGTNTGGVTNNGGGTNTSGVTNNGGGTNTGGATNNGGGTNTSVVTNNRGGTNTEMGTNTGDSKSPGGGTGPNVEDPNYGLFNLELLQDNELNRLVQLYIGREKVLGVNLGDDDGLVGGLLND